LSLDDVVPTAAQILKSLHDGITLVSQLGLIETPMVVAFSGGADARIALFGEFLIHIEDFKDEIMRQRGQWAGLFEWPDELGEVASAARKRKSRASPSSLGDPPALPTALPGRQQKFDSSGSMLLWAAIRPL
jgi:hypothetical protein